MFQLDLPIVDAETIIRTEDEDEVIIQTNQALSTSNEELLLM